MRRNLVVCGLVMLSVSLYAQRDSLALQYAGTITQKDLRQHLEILASDAYLGRDTGKEGQKMAAAYLKEQFVSFGIPPLENSQIQQGYYQPYELVERRNGSIGVQLKEGELKFPDEVVYLNEVVTGSEEIKELSVLRANDLSNGSERFKGVEHVLLVPDVGMSLSGMRKMLERTGDLAARVVFVLIEEPTFEVLQGFVHADGSRMLLADEKVPAERKEGLGRVQTLFIPAASLERMIGIRKTRIARSLPTGYRLKTNIRLSGIPRETRLTAENVLAYIEGSDKRDELVVITAHYDHIGVEHGVVYNGADDDGSGTVALLEIAEAFSQAKAAGHGPRRSILVMPVSGEEKGLLGSRFYSENPVFPLDATVSNLNIDMIGRTDSAHRDSAAYVYIIGSDRLSSDLHAVNEEANQVEVRLALNYSFNAEDDPNRFYYRSDHYNFARKGVPSIFYFSGVHEDYHQPGDDVEKIQFDLLEKRARLVFYTAWLLSNREDRVRVDRPVK